MLQGHRMVLKRRTQVGHAGMAGVAGFGKKTQIGQPQYPYNLRPFVKQRHVKMLSDSGVNEHEADQKRTHQEVNKKEI